VGENVGMALSLVRAGELFGELDIVTDRGLSEEEFRRVERALGFRFSPDHRELLTAGLPRGGRWPDWRGDLAMLAGKLAEPVEGVLFDVEENGFWHGAWGERPEGTAEALAKARGRLRSAPRLVPIYGHRYCPALPQAEMPVYSVVQSDVIVYGCDIEDYLRHEFGTAQEFRPAKYVPFWGDITG
jgi:hypothetical protein